MKCLQEFDTIKEFQRFVKNNYINNWCVFDLSMYKRTEKVKDNSNYKSIKKIAIEKRIKANEMEIISWLDTMNFLYNSFALLDDNYNNIHILQELHIPFSNKRSDYVLCKDNKVLILEFSFDKWDATNMYENKLTQAIGYKELLSNILPKHIVIGTYTCLLKADKDKDGNDIFIEENDKKVHLNENRYKELADYIAFFFKDTNKDSIIELNKLYE